MIGFEDFIAERNEKESKRRHVLLVEMQNIDTCLIETPIPQGSKQQEKISYRLLEERRNEEIIRLKNISSMINDEARGIKEKWEKEGYTPY